MQIEVSAIVGKKIYRESLRVHDDQKSAKGIHRAVDVLKESLLALLIRENVL